MSRPDEEDGRFVLRSELGRSGMGIDEALLALRAGAAECGFLRGACAKYAVVIHRWKNAKPRSITLEKAKARSRALHCPAVP